MKVTTRAGSKVVAGFAPDFLMAEVRQAGERAVKGVSDIIRDEGEKIQELARDNAPYDDGFLEAAIKVEEGKEENRRLAVTVYVDGSMPGSHDRKTVGDYALLMHEGLGPYGSGRYKPGEGTLTKIAAGFKAGGKFLERALNERRKALMARAAEAARKALKR